MSLGEPPICYSKCHLLFTTVHTKYWLQPKIIAPVFNKTGIFRLNHLHLVSTQSDVKLLGGVQHLAQGHVDRTACYWWMGQLWWRCNRTLSAYRTGCFTERRPPQRAQIFLPLLLTHKRGNYFSSMPPNLNPPNIIINMAEFIDHLSSKGVIASYVNKPFILMSNASVSVASPAGSLTLCLPTPSLPCSSIL